MTSDNASTDSPGEYLLDRKDLRDWHYDHEGRRSGDHQPHCGFQAPVPGRAWTHCVCFGAAVRAVEPLLYEVERLRDLNAELVRVLDLNARNAQRIRDERDRAVEVLREVNDCCNHDWIEGVTDVLYDRTETP